MNCGLYQIKNLKNDKFYIGSSHNISRRFSEHLSMLRKNKHHSRHLQNAWNKYGESNFEFSKILICSKENVLDYEQRALDCFNPSYNVLPNARNSSGRILTEETKEKIRQKAVGRKCKPRSQEYREKVSKRCKGIMPSESHMKAFQEGRKNRVYTEEQKQKISEKLKESYANGKRIRFKNEEYRNKIAKTVSKLSKDDVDCIKLNLKNGVQGKILAEKFNISKSTISEIKHGKTYKWAM